MEEGLFALMLGSVPAIALVWLTVEGLKRFDFVRDDGWVTAPRAAILTALVLTGIALAREFVPESAQYIDVAAPIVFGGLVAGLFYDLAGELLFDRVASAIKALFGSK